MSCSDSGSPDDEGTTQMMSTLSDPDVVSGFSSMVCISVENGSTTCMQFSSIYPVLLVPCVYFIGKNQELCVSIIFTVRQSGLFSKMVW